MAFIVRRRITTMLPNVLRPPSSILIPWTAAPRRIPSPFRSSSSTSSSSSPPSSSKPPHSPKRSRRQVRKKVDEKVRHLLSISDLSQVELENVVARALMFRDQIRFHDKTAASACSLHLNGQTVAMMFSKRSTRTRVSTEAAVVQLGGHPMFLGKDDIQLGVNESLLDTARVISSMTACIVARVGPHSDILTLAEHSKVPVINALSDAYHPLQAIADLLTIKQAFPNHFPRRRGSSRPPTLKLAWIGDANNVLYDLMTACAKSGIEVAIATPREYPVNPEILEHARVCANNFGTGAHISTTHDPEEAVKNADVLVTDTWVSMGQEDEKALRLKLFEGFQISEELAEKGGAKSDWKFMHCLPRKQEEVTDDVFYNEKRSLVFKEAENRLFAAIAVLEAFVLRKGTIKGKRRSKTKRGGKAVRARAESEKQMVALAAEREEAKKAE